MIEAPPAPDSTPGSTPTATPTGLGVVETHIEHDPWGAHVDTAFGPLAHVEAIDDEPEHFQLDGRGSYDLADAWELHEALAALLGSVDPGRLGRAALAHRQGARPAPTTPRPGAGGDADVAARLAPGTATTLVRIAGGQLGRDRQHCLVWAVTRRMVDTSVLDDLDDLRRRGLVDGIEATEHGRRVAAQLGQATSQQAVA